MTITELRIVEQAIKDSMFSSLVNDIAIAIIRREIEIKIEENKLTPLRT